MEMINFAREFNTDQTRGGKRQVTLSSSLYAVWLALGVPSKFSPKLVTMLTQIKSNGTPLPSSQHTPNSFEGGCYYLKGTLYSKIIQRISLLNLISFMFLCEREVNKETDQLLF